VSDRLRTPAPYGSAKDLPSYQELSQQIQGLKLATHFIARSQRSEIIQLEQQVERLARVVDDFYERLGSRNWIFHGQLNVDAIELLLGDTSDPESAEERFIELHRDPDSTKFWDMGLWAHDGLRERRNQITRARDHYEAGHFDSCAMHLIAVMDGFVNDFAPGERRGLASRDPEEMTAWDSVVGHHMGLTHVMKAFKKTIKKRMDDEVFELHRHGIMHGSVTNFDNVIVATKAWNMLFAVADWATATKKAAEPKEPKPTWGDVWSLLKKSAATDKYEREFVASSIEASDPNFATNEVVKLASDFLTAWEHRRWGLVARFMPPVLRRSTSDGEAAADAKGAFEQYDLAGWAISSMTLDRPSAAEITAIASVNGQLQGLRFRLVMVTADGNVAIPGGQEEASWHLAVWAPHTFFGSADPKSSSVTPDS